MRKLALRLMITSLVLLIGELFIISHFFRHLLKGESLADILGAAAGAAGAGAALLVTAAVYVLAWFAQHLPFEGVLDEEGEDTNSYEPSSPLS